MQGQMSKGQRACGKGSTSILLPCFKGMAMLLVLLKRPMVVALGIYRCIAFVPLVCYTSKKIAEGDQDITLALSLVNAVNLRIKDNN